MAQDPMKLDQIQIEPGATGTRMIRRATDGSLEFLDSLVTGGITLSNLAGFRAISNIMVVGKSGAGAAYSTIQSALDAIPASSSEANPYFVFIGPGVYRETLNIVRDGVTLFGLGAVIQSLGEAVPNGPDAYHTVVIQAALGTIPKKVSLINLPITNAHDNYACIRVVGGAASQVVQTGLFVQDCQVKTTGAGYPLWATSVNHLFLTGGSMKGSGLQSLIRVEDCASFLAEGVEGIPAIQLNFDSTGDIPSEAGSSSTYCIESCSGLCDGSLLAPPIASTLLGRGTLKIVGCATEAGASFSGDQSVKVIGSRLGNLTLNDSIAVSLDHSRKGTITSGGTSTLEEPIQRGAVSFAAETTKVVLFDTPQPNANYSVNLEPGGVVIGAWWVTAKTAAGFTLNFAVPQTCSAIWTVSRVMGGALN